MTEIAGRTVLVTGAASGLGCRMALRFARLGGRLVLWDVDAAGLERVAGDIEAQVGGSAFVDRVDVADRAQVSDAARRVTAAAGPVDVLVNNAGITHGGLLHELPDEVIEATFRVNALALFWVTRAFLPAMLERDDGHVVTIASAAGRVGVARLSAYAASKHAAVGFDESLRAELRQIAPGVRTTVVSPYFINTGLFEGVQSRFPRLLPLLDQERVAERIVRAVQHDELVVSLPLMVRIAPWLRLLPVRWVDRLADFLGVNDAMKSFVGRAGKPGRDQPAA